MTTASVSLPEAQAAHLLAHRIVAQLDATSSAARIDFGQVLDDLNGRVRTARRPIVGIVGAPGAGKTTMAREVAEVLNERGISTAILPMDGFHLSNLQLGRLGLSDVKGAPQTFDSAGFVATLERIAQGADDVYVPVFHREIEESYGADAVVSRSAQVVLVEGNYLLSDESHFGQVRSLLSESWFLKPDEHTRVDRLVLRHMRHGRSPQAAIDWALGTDQDNAAAIMKNAKNATLIVELT